MLKKELFHSPFSGGYAASFCGNSASATNAAEDKEAGGRAKAAAMRGAAEGRWSAERGGRSGGVQSLGSRGREGSARSCGSIAESWCTGTSGEARAGSSRGLADERRPSDDYGNDTGVRVAADATMLLPGSHRTTSAWYWTG